VRNKNSNEKFALKIIKKKAIVEMGI